MKKIKLTESDLLNLISQVINEQSYRGGIIKEGDIPCDIWCERKYAKRGSRGDVVKMIQHLLARGCGEYGPYNPDNMGGGMNQGCAENWENCDGKYEKETKKAVEHLQESLQLEIDGKVGIDTLTALCSICYGTGSPKDSAEYILCNKQCDCDDQEDITIIDGIDDVIENIDCPGDGECDFDDWCFDDNIDGGCGGDHWRDCERIKACLYYASRQRGERWYHFIKCMQGKFSNLG